MAGVNFTDYFWGEKHEGFNVLYHNMKSGSLAAKELTDYFRERAKLEEENAKTHQKLAKQLTAGQLPVSGGGGGSGPQQAGGGCGTFGPLLVAHRVTAEKLALVHNQWTVGLNELAKEVSKYHDECVRRHKIVKDEMGPTQDAVKAVQEASLALTKAKDILRQKTAELEKLKQQQGSTGAGASGSGPPPNQKEIEKSEAKHRKAQEDYKVLSDKYVVARDDFEKKMSGATKQFQEIETAHLNQLRAFVETYCQLIDNNLNQLGRVHQEYRVQMTELTVDNLLEQFTLAKLTGLERPGAVDVDKISLTSVGGPPSDISNPETASLASGNAASTGAGAGNLLNLGDPSSPAQPVSPIPSQPTQPSMVTSNSGFARNKNWSKSISNMSLSSSRSMILRRRNNGGGNSNPTSNPPPPTATSSNKGSLMSLVSGGGGGGGNNNVTDGLATRNQLHFQQDNSPQQQQLPSPSRLSPQLSPFSSFRSPTGSRGRASSTPSRAISLLNLFIPSSASSMSGNDSFGGGGAGQPTAADNSCTNNQTADSSAAAGHQGNSNSSRSDQFAEAVLDTSGRTSGGVGMNNNNNDSNNNNILKTAGSSCNIPSAVHGAADSCEDGDDEEEEPSFSALPPAASTNNDPSPSRSPFQPNLGNWTVSGFLRRKGKKKSSSSSLTKNNKKGGDHGDDHEGQGGAKGDAGGSDGEDVRKSKTPTPEVDEDGYSKQPDRRGTSSDPWADFNRPTDKFYSSSDESDDDTAKRKIKVKINEIQPNSSAPKFASVDELRSVMGNLELNPPVVAPKEHKSHLTELSGGGGDLSGDAIRRTHSQSNLNKPSHDLLGLTLHPIDIPIDDPSTKSAGPLPNSGSDAPASDAGSTKFPSSLHHHPSNDGDEPPPGPPPPIPPPEKPSTSNLQSSLSTKPEAVADKFADLSVASNTSKEVQDIFGSDFTGGPALPPKTSVPQRPSSVHRDKISSSLIALPRPPSRISSAQLRANRGGSSSPKNTPLQAIDNGVVVGGKGGSGSSPPPPLLPAKSTDSATSYFRQSSISSLGGGGGAVGMSRGPSPLTIGASDVVPLAVAFQEVCHACFRGAEESQVQTRLIGDLMVSFPAGIVNVLVGGVGGIRPTERAPLVFRIKRFDVLESIVPNKQLITEIKDPSISTNGGLESSDENATASTSSKVFQFDMKALRELLKAQSEQNPTASYFNIDILKYQVKAKPGASSCPLQLVAYWKCESSHTDLRLDYKYNGHTMPSPFPLLNISVAVPVSGGVQNMQSQPTGTWLKESNRALWKFPELSGHSGNGGIGSLRGRFQLSDGPGAQGTIAAQFNCEGTTLSGVDFELVGHGYRLSLVKKRFVSGKYICDGNASSNSLGSRYAVPPGKSTTSASGSES